MGPPAYHAAVESSAVDGNSGLRPGLCLIAFAALVIGLSSVRVATGWPPAPERILFEVGHCALGGGVGWWGWSRLRRAKATRPDMSWRQFLQRDLIGLAIAAALFGAVMALPAECREGLWRSFRELVELMSAARGRP